MGNFDKFLKIIGAITFSIFVMYILHESMHLTMTKNLIATEVSKQLNSKENKDNIINIFSSVIEEKLEIFHDHINDNEMTLISTLLYQTISKNNLENLTPEEIAYWRKFINDREQELKKERTIEKEKNAAEQNKNIDDFRTALESVDPNNPEDQKRNSNLKLKP